MAGRSRWVQRASLMLAATALALAITLLGARHHRQQLLFDSLAAEVGIAGPKAKAVRAAVDKLQQDQARLVGLRSSRGEPGLLDIWEEATQILPSHSWLAELRLNETPEGRQVVMTGFSAAAASLVGLVDRSPLFGDASLAGTITMDQAENKERFVIQANVRKPGEPKTATR